MEQQFDVFPENFVQIKRKTLRKWRFSDVMSRDFRSQMDEN